MVACDSILSGRRPTFLFEPKTTVREFVVRACEQIVQSVRSIATPIVRALELELVDVECAGQGARTMVRVFIDKPNGVNVSDCEQVHVSLSHALDVQDPISHRYTLEVSSPGLDRPLKRREDYARSIGKLVSVKLTRQIDGQWRVCGRLRDLTDDGVMLEIAGPKQNEMRLFAWDTINQTRLEVEF
jgi:ribosome maturation factor RimP